jgi:DNA-binding transcriptional MerR regulator
VASCVDWLPEYRVYVAGMRTGEVAEEAGVNLKTLRYYERRGLLPEPPRRESGYPIYGPEAARIVRFIKRAQQLGFRLEEVESLLEMAAGGPECCEVAQQLAQHRIAELDRRIADPRAMRGALQRLLATCTMPSVGRGVDRGHPADVEDHHLGLLLDALQQALSEAGSAS